MFVPRLHQTSHKESHADANMPYVLRLSTQKCVLIIVVVIISNISYVVYVNGYIEVYKKMVMGVVYVYENKLLL